MNLDDLSSRSARPFGLVTAATLGAIGVLLTLNLARPLASRVGPHFLRNADFLLASGPSFMFASIVIALLATAPDHEHLQERLFVTAVILLAAGGLMLLTGQWLLLIYVFFGGPLLILVSVVGVLLATYHLRRRDSPPHE